MNIKFRGISDGKRKEWVYGNYYYDADYEESYIIPFHNDFIPDDRIKIIHFTRGQWTGRQDKKKVDIYQGDIVRHRMSGFKYTCHQGPVIYDSESSKYYLSWSNYCHMIFDDSRFDDFEIIGTIHDKYKER